MQKKSKKIGKTVIQVKASGTKYLDDQLIDGPTTGTDLILLLFRMMGI